MIRRTVDLATFRFVDEAVDIGGTNRMVAATALDDGYLVYLQRPQASELACSFASRRGPLIRAAADNEGTPVPNAIDGFRVEGGAKR